MKLLMESWRKFVSEAEIREATDEELEMIKDALALSPIALPFNHIFGNKKRKLQIIGNTNVYDMDSMLQQFSRKVIMVKKETKKEGRTIIDTIPMVKLGTAEISFNKRTKLVEPRPGIKIEEMPLEKYISELIKIKESLPRYVESLEDLNHNQMVKISNKLIKYFYPTTGSGGDSILYNKFVNYKGQIKNLFETLLSAIPEISAYQKLDQLKEIFIETKKDLMKKDAIWSPVKESFLIMSRDPIDVFRMSDHTGLNSCHSLPSGKGTTIWDEHNICAAAEAHGNGAVIYSINKEDFEDKFGTLNQETLDSLDSKEIFYDSDRNVDGIEPSGRVRLRKLLVDGTEFAALERKIYGKFPPGVRDDLSKLITSLQGEKIINLEKDENGFVNLDNAERFGGSYEDNGVGALFSDMLKTLNIDTVGEIKYNDEFELALRGVSKPDWISTWMEIQNGDHDRASNNNDLTLSFNLDFDPEDHDNWSEDADANGSGFFGARLRIDLSLIDDYQIDLERFIEDIQDETKGNLFTEDIESSISRNYDWIDPREIEIEHVSVDDDSGKKISVFVRFYRYGYRDGVDDFLYGLDGAFEGMELLYEKLDDEDYLESIFEDYITYNFDKDELNTKFQDALNYHNATEVVSFEISGRELEMKFSFPFQISQSSVDAFKNAGIKFGSERAKKANEFYQDFRDQSYKVVLEAIKDQFNRAPLADDRNNGLEKILPEFYKGGVLMGIMSGKTESKLEIRFSADLTKIADESSLRNLDSVIQFTVENQEEVSNFCTSFWEDAIQQILSIQESRRRNIKLKILRG